MKLYHSSFKQHSPQTVICAKGENNLYPVAIEKIEAQCPEGKPSRAKAVFAANSPVWAYLFAEAQYQESLIFLYEVKMTISCRAPMCIVHEINKRIQSENDYQDLVNEYWNPKMEWNFYEYFGPELHIIKPTELPSEMDLTVARLKYSADVKQASSVNFI